MRTKDRIKGITLALLLVSSLVGFAQTQQRTPEERAQRQTMWMQKNLGLTDDQNKKVYDIMLYHAQQADNEKTMPPSRDKKYEKRELKRDTDAELRTVLTGDQYQRYQQHVMDMKQKRQQRKAEMVGY